MPDNDKIAKLTADAIRANGQETAQVIRNYAAKAREEGEHLGEYAEQVANAITAASAQAADRIAEYIKRCEEVSASLQQHEKLLSRIPETEEIKGSPEQTWPEPAREPARPERRLDWLGAGHTGSGRDGTGRG